MFKRKLRETASTQERQSMFDAPFWKFFSSLGDYFLLTCFWIATSLPLVTIGASTVAVFYVTLKNQNGQGGTLWKMYWKSFCENWKQATFIWLLYVFIVLDAYIVCTILQGQGQLDFADFAWDGRYGFTFAVVTLLYIVLMLYTAALMAFFRQTTKQCLISAFCMTFHQIFSTLLFMLIIGVLFYLTLYWVPPLAFIGLPLSIWLISLRMNVIFHQQIDRARKRGENAGADQ